MLARAAISSASGAALAQHHGSLRLHDHHAAQHVGGATGIIERNQTLVALPLQPALNGLPGAPEGDLVKGWPRVRESGRTHR